MPSVITVLDLDPCNNASCLFYSKPVAYSSQQCDCVCETSCPSYREEMCASNGRTFRNFCLLKKEICETRANYTHYHPGSCVGMCFRDKLETIVVMMREAVAITIIDNNYDNNLFT